jgi:N-acetyl sugar amidotransferase
MDTSDPEIEFDDNGACNHCKKYDELSKKYILPSEERKDELEKIVKRIKDKGKKKEYDCIIGVSGGIDSSYTAYLVKQLGLRPLAVHLDNGWDSELAVSNIEKTLKILNIDLYTYIINWEEFRDLQLAFLRASTPDLEISSDHAIIAILAKAALKKKVKYIILGLNLVTEAILPRRWSCGHGDWGYIKSIHREFGKIKLLTYPHFNFVNWLSYYYAHHPQFINILDYIDYTRDEAKRTIEEALGWIDYGGKHCESIYTRFAQGYILPNKFDYDKRRAHLSTLICSKQMAREEALEEIKKYAYPSEELKQSDRGYVIKKLGISETEFERIMLMPHKRFEDYPSYGNSLFYGIARSIWRIIKKFQINEEK